MHVRICQVCLHCLDHQGIMGVFWQVALEERKLLECILSQIFQRKLLLLPPADIFILLPDRQLSFEPNIKLHSLEKYNKTFDDICQLEESLSESSVFQRYNSTDMKRIMFVSFSNPLTGKAAGHGGLRQVAV